MTLSMTQTPESIRKPYDAPALESLGTLAEHTAGPDGGNIDQLVGGSGGFQQPDPS